MNIRPLPGKMIVKLESLLKDTGLIKVPERYKKAPSLIGRITAISMRPEDFRDLGVKAMVGNRIIVSSLCGRHIEKDTSVYLITDILAIVPDTMDISAHSMDAPRCRHCGQVRSGVNQNMLMWRGVCPRCGKDSQGEIPDTSIKVTDADRAAMAV